MAPGASKPISYWSISFDEEFKGNGPRSFQAHFLLFSSLLSKSNLKELTPGESGPISYWLSIHLNMEIQKNWFQELSSLFPIDSFISFDEWNLKEIVPGASKPISFWFSISVDKQI